MLSEPLTTFTTKVKRKGNSIFSKSQIKHLNLKFKTPEENAESRPPDMKSKEKEQSLMINEQWPMTSQFP